MHVTLDLSSSSREEERRPQNEHLPVVDLSSTHCERTSISTSKLKCEDQKSVIQKVAAERNDRGFIDEERGSECYSGLQSSSTLTLKLARLAEGFKCGRLKHELNNRQKLCNDTIVTSSSSHDISSSTVDVQFTATSKLQGQCCRTLHYSSEHIETDIATQCDSKFRHISHNKKPPVYMHICKNRTSFHSFPNFLFAYLLLISLFSPSLSLSTSSVSTNPNLKSWSLAALETIDTGMERETNIHQVPIPDMTAIVGRLFQFQIPSSAFSGEVSSYKVCCSVFMEMMSLF